MKSTLSDNKQLFNVKSIAYDTSREDLAEGEFGIYEEGATNSIPSGLTFATMPDNFYFASKIGGKLYLSFDCMGKEDMLNQVFKEYSAEQVEVWKGTITGCDCIKELTARINLDEDALMRRDGLTWTHRENVNISVPKALNCTCDCTGKKVYDNHIATRLLADKINSSQSQYYTASIELPDGTQMDSAAVDAFIAANEAVNTDDDDTNDSALLVLVITGIASTPLSYADIEVNYIYPRGVSLNPSVSVNGGETNIAFTKTQELAYEIGAGYDLRDEEFCNMNNYTDLNYQMQLSDGTQNPKLKYQFENFKNYDTITFEFDSLKVERAGDGDKKRFGVLLGAETGSAVSTELQAMFIPV